MRARHLARHWAGAAEYPEASPLSAPHQLHQFAVVDLETTGFSPRTCQIIEVGALRVDLLTGEQASFSSFVRCDDPLPFHISRLTGISSDMLRGAPDAQDVVADLSGFIRGLPIVAYNAGFDMSFLRSAAPEAFESHRVVCALQAARRYLKLPDYKLATVARHFGVAQASAHRALDDCRTTLSIFEGLRAISGGRGR